MVLPPGAGKTGKIIAAVEPFVRAAVLGRYKRDVDKPNVCPGEKECEIFQGARGRTRLEKERNVCRSCDLFPTKTERHRKSQKGLEDLLYMAQYAKRRKDSGYPMPMFQITNLTLETMLLLDEMEDQQKIVVQMELKTIFMAGFQLKEG